MNEGVFQDGDGVFQDNGYEYEQRSVLGWWIGTWIMSMNGGKFQDGVYEYEWKCFSRIVDMNMNGGVFQDGGY